eukprot:NODE_8470_length_549_cov_43.632701_g8447_i0.p2 GENE.NODE_8470_length_549_cov_43.632701_g8447_i0~~NODE_8470_length_549_cov_43.632701_g8447_i0.p2  ORF type:complete len:136 (+),score=25.74 NODE_8470_length_549_cov_43.632701_g8447_i0:57-464(+)
MALRRALRVGVRRLDAPVIPAPTEYPVLQAEDASPSSTALAMASMMQSLGGLAQAHLKSKNIDVSAINWDAETVVFPQAAESPLPAGIVEANFVGQVVGNADPKDIREAGAHAKANCPLYNIVKAQYPIAVSFKA